MTTERDTNPKRSVSPPWVDLSEIPDLADYRRVETVLPVPSISRRDIIFPSNKPNTGQEDSEHTQDPTIVRRGIPQHAHVFTPYKENPTTLPVEKNNTAERPENNSATDVSGPSSSSCGETLGQKLAAAGVTTTTQPFRRQRSRSGRNTRS